MNTSPVSAPPQAPQAPAQPSTPGHQQALFERHLNNRPTNRDASTTAPAPPLPTDKRRALLQRLLDAHPARQHAPPPKPKHPPSLGHDDLPATLPLAKPDNLQRHLTDQPSANQHGPHPGKIIAADDQHNAGESCMPMPMPLPAPPGERAPWNMASQPSVATQDLQLLVERLQLQLLGTKAAGNSQALLHAQLPQLGPVQVRLCQLGGSLQVEVQATTASIRHLHGASADLLERLQRLDPSQPVSLTFAASSGDGERGSRNKRHVYDEQWPEA